MGVPETEVGNISREVTRKIRVEIRKERVREKFNAHDDDDDDGGIILLQQGPWKDLSCY
jgi:hypothetical protein